MLKVPGVGAAAAGTNVPIGPASVHLFSLRPRTDWRTRDPHTVSMALATIMGDYFTVEGVPVVMGRAFSAGDGPASPRVLIVNQSAARSLWPGESPIGKQLYSFYGAATVVGVVRDTKYMTLGDDRVPFVYAPMSQDDSFGFVSFIARSVDPRAALVALRRTVADVAPNLKAPTLPGLGPRLVADQIASALAPQRFGATLLLGFALAALCVSAVGIYGTVAYAVAGRASEIAIRVALGARGSDVLALIVSESARSVVAGMVLGVAGIVLSTRLVAHFLFGVAPTDWVAFACGVAVVGIAALAAAFVPCVRALRIDPARAMRAE
jgi:ABC-type antimicrobial peptide transport system permease subunit